MESYKIRMDHQKLVHWMYVLLFFREMVFAYTNIEKAIPSTIVSLIRNGCLLLFLFLAFFCLLRFQRMESREIVIIAVVVSVMAISSYFSRYYILFEGAVLISCCKNIDFDRLVRYALKLQIVVGIIVILLALSGVITMGYMARSSNEVLRYAMGFSHPNRLGVYVFQIISEIIYLRREALKWSLVMACFGGAVLTYIISASKTSFAATILFLAAISFYMAFKVYKQSSRKQWRLFKYIIIIGIAVLVWFLYQFIQNPVYFIEKIPLLKTLYSRISLAVKYYEAYGIGLFGHRIKTGVLTTIPGHGLGYYFLDCAYAALFIRDGILAAVIFITASLLFFRDIRSKNNLVGLIIVLLYWVYLIVENAPLNVTFNIFLVGMANVIFLQPRRAENRVGRP